MLCVSEEHSSKIDNKSTRIMFQLDANLCFHSAFPTLSIFEVNLGTQICLTLDTLKMYASTTHTESFS